MLDGMSEKGNRASGSSDVHKEIPNRVKEDERPNVRNGSGTPKATAADRFPDPPQLMSQLPIPVRPETMGQANADEKVTAVGIDLQARIQIQLCIERSEVG